MNLPEILESFDNWERSGNGRFMAACPMPEHRDSDPSVSVTQDIETGKIMMFCWGCNTKAPALMQALGLRLSDLFGDPGHPAAVKQNSASLTVSPKDQADLTRYVNRVRDNIPLASTYIDGRFGLDTFTALELGLGVDNGENGIERPLSCAAFNSGTPHLIIPFFNPDGEVVGMQGRRLTDGEPRWRSVSGSGWSKIGVFGWDLGDPVIITEGPSDALSVVGLAGLPSLAIRGASNTSDDVCKTILEWLSSRKAVIIGDNGDAGQKFASELSQGTGIPAYQLPEGYSDVCEYLGDGGDLSDAVAVALSITRTVRPAHADETAVQKAARLKEWLLKDLANAVYDEDLKAELRRMSTWERDAIFNEISANAPQGQRTDTRARIRTLQDALLDRAAPPAGGGGGGNAHGIGDDPAQYDHLPEIVWNQEDQLHVTEADIRRAMGDYEGRDYYQAAAGQYVKVVRDELVNLKDAGIKSMLGVMGHWRVINGGREIGHVPQEAARIVTDPSWTCDIPTIKRRVEVPFMLEDGSIVAEPGFHDESGIYLLPRWQDRIYVPEVPSIITDEHVLAAKKILEDVVDGFVFKDQASKTNLIAMTLTSPLRELFNHNPMVPMLTATAPQSGSGKGTSVRVPLSTAGVGPFTLSTTAYNPDENEFEKKLVGKLLKKSTYIFLDNIRAQVNSSVLEQMLTAANYDGRTLGYSEVNSLSTLVLWVSTLQSTGAFNRDLTRRCVPVELIKNYKGEWEHKNIDTYLADMRGQMIWACFVAARKWLQDGAPISTSRLDGFTGWVEVIGGILEHVLGYEGFLGNLDSFRNQQDAVGMTIDGILERWLTLYGQDEHPARMAIEDFEDPALHQLLGLHNPSTRQVLNALDRQLTGQHGYIVGNSHMWQVIGPRNYGHEGIKKLYRCIPIRDGNEE